MKKVFHIETASNVNNERKVRTVNWVAKTPEGEVCYRGTTEVPFDGDEDVQILRSLKNVMKGVK